jgi:predicted DNA-binding transcriptional regulator AlpA
MTADTPIDEARKRALAIEEARRRALAKEIFKFSDLVLLGYVDDRATLRRWIKDQGFPAPLVLGPNSLGWIANEVHGWIGARPRGAAPQRSRPGKRAA